MPDDHQRSKLCKTLKSHVILALVKDKFPQIQLLQWQGYLRKG
jgi:hypothetical protein